MRRILPGVFVTMLLAAPAAAQGLEGYAAGAFGGWSHRFNSGSLFGGTVGVDIGVAPAVAIEIDGALVGGASGNLLLALSPGAKVRFRRWVPNTVAPFVVGGYSYLHFFEGVSHAFNIGGGVDYPLSESRAVRVEVRDMIRRDFPSHYFTVRVGVTFR